MPKYPITPEYIKAAPNEIQELYERLEAWVLNDICSRFKRSDAATNTAIEQIRALQRRGYTYSDIKKFIQTTLKLADAEYDRIMQQAIEDNQRYYADVLNEATLVEEVFEQEAMTREIDAIIEQCKGDLNNLTQSLGFSVKVNGQRQFLPVAQAYQRILSDAEMKVWSGTQSYNEAIREAVKQLTDSGLKTVTWAKDTPENVYHVDHADVAARRAVMTGITQLSSKYSEQIREEVPTEYIEVSAHRGARDTDKPGIPWANHKAWQGKIYSTKDGDKYPNIYKVCGWGDGDGLEGWNCRHMHFPFWDGISERTWTDDKLANIDPPPFTYQGKEYTAYEATQKQRQIERALRKIKRELIGYKAAGDDEAYKAAAIRYRNLNSAYTDFSKAAGLRETERGNIAAFGPKDGSAALKFIK